MTTAKQITDELIAKAQRMQVYEVNAWVRDGWLPQGTVPFDMTIKENIATITVIAESIEDAQRQVSEYMDGQ